ncbi:MAG: glutamate formimidoyltransferase [Bacteroidales bacterium]|nr:glutamate formimidoyltransferase [Bacteroidales bacterium]
MASTNKIVECVPNFSEGRDGAKMEKIIDCFRGKQGIKLLDYSNDIDHNRMVITAIGSPEAMKEVMVEAIGTAVREIDLTKHQGQHPRTGAADVIPFIPVSNMTMEEAVQLAKDVAKEAAEKFRLPMYLYEKAASAPHRENLADVRKGHFEGLAEKMKNPFWKPDFGPGTPHPTAGATVIGARNFLVAYNVNLRSNDLDIAKAIAKKVRHIGGGLRFCKAMGVDLKEKNMVQVSMNLTDFTKTSVYQAFEMVKMEAARYGISVAGSEVIGLLPLGVLVDTANYYLGIEDFTIDRVLEYRMLE